MTEKADIKSLQRALLTALSVELRALHFSPQLSQQTFRLKTEHHTWVVHVGFIRHPNDVDATVDLGVSLTQVEELLAKAGWNQKGGATIGAELGNLVDRRPRRWTIKTEADAEDVARQMAGEIVKYGVDWLRRFSELETVYNVLVHNDQQSWLIMPLHVKRCLILVALAVIVRTKGEAKVLASECGTFLRTRNEPLLATFEEQSKRLLEL